jgi:putative ABC transport system permease protein
MTLAWLLGLLKTRTGRIFGSVAGIALTVALIAALGTFVETSAATMTQRAVATVPVDWQVEVTPGSSTQELTAAIGRAAPVKQVESVGYAKVDGFEFKTGDSIQTTGEGKVVGIAPSYLSTFPQGFRLLAGRVDGPILLQQTAANLHAGPGDTVTIHRPGLPDAQITVAGVIDLKTADGFFQAIGVPAGAAPQAPPDNAALIPMESWKVLFDPQAAVRPDSVRLQLHVALDRTSLPSDPGAAYLTAIGQGHNLEARVAGSAILSNNLAARLDATRQDALYVRVLFLFLGTPGACLAALITIAIAQSGAERRRRDQSLLRLRGANGTTILGYSLAEAAATGLAGSLLGIALAELSVRSLLGQDLAGGYASWLWPAAAIVVGIALAGLAIAVPAWRSMRNLSVTSARQTVGAEIVPVWQRLSLDFILLALSALIFWKTAATGYQVVLAPEGVPATSVDYTAFLAPLLLWVLGCSSFD